MVIKVKPVEDDISIVSYRNEEFRIEIGNEDRRRRPKEDEAAESQGTERHSNRCRKFFATWSSTLPDAVGITGTQYIVNSQDSSLRRLVWIVALLGGMAALSYQIVDRAIFFASNPKSVDVEIQYASELTFPAVTICNCNNYRNVYGQLEYHPFGQFLSDYDSLEPPYQTVNYSLYEPMLSGANTTALFLEFAHQMEYGHMFMYAVWNGNEYLTPANFTRTFTDYGVCYTFNSGLDGMEPLKQRVAGKAYGVGVFLNAEQYYYYHGSRPFSSAGFVVAVHDQNDVPEVESHGVGVAPGTEAGIGLRMKRSTNLPPPYGVCGTKELKYFSSYTINTCRQECLIDYILETCGCVEPYMAVSSEMRVCDPIEVFSCSYHTSAWFRSEGECECPVPCSLTSYTTSLSYTRYPSDFQSQRLVEYYSNQLGVALPADLYETNFAMIQVYFEELSVDQLTQQEAYTFFAFLCDIGGSLGLWLGGSILTFVEILDHLTHTVFIPGSSSLKHGSA